MAIETIVWHCKKCKWMEKIMGMITGIPNWLSLFVAVGALAYITRDKWRGKISL